MCANSWCRAVTRYLPVILVMLTSSGLSGCKSLTEKYIALEVWKYEKLFGHLPPGFVPPGAMPVAAAAMRPCNQPAACQPAPCGGGHGVGMTMAGSNCDQCQGGGMVEGGMPSGTIVSPGIPTGAGSLPVGPGGSPGPSAGMPTPAAVTSSRPVVISDEVVLP